LPAAPPIKKFFKQKKSKKKNHSKPILFVLETSVKTFPILSARLKYLNAHDEEEGIFIRAHLIDAEKNEHYYCR
jgi:hypothetical protein